MAGAGSSPAGTGFAGFGTPSPATGAPADAPLVATFVDPVRRDYVYDETGNRKQDSAAKQLVYLAVATIRGSSADPKLGIDRPPRVATASYVAARSAMYARAFAPLAGIATLISVDVARDVSGRSSEVVRWFDEAARAERTTAV